MLGYLGLSSKENSARWHFAKNPKDRHVAWLLAQSCLTDAAQQLGSEQLYYSTAESFNWKTFECQSLILVTDRMGAQHYLSSSFHACFTDAGVFEPDSCLSHMHFATGPSS